MKLKINTKDKMIIFPGNLSEMFFPFVGKNSLKQKIPLYLLISYFFLVFEVIDGFWLVTYTYLQRYNYKDPNFILLQNVSGEVSVLFLGRCGFLLWQFLRDGDRFNKPPLCVGLQLIAECSSVRSV